MAEGDPQAEYADVSSNVRHFQTIRFAQLTIFIALTGGLLNVLFGRAATLPLWGSIIIRIAGLLISLLYWVLQERTMLYWRHFIHRAAELEKLLGYKQYSTRPRAGLFTGTNAMRLFFLVITLFWVSSLLWLQ
jgi:hypothetical protein